MKTIGIRSIYLGEGGAAPHYHSIVIGDNVISRKANDVVVGETLFGKKIRPATKKMIIENPYGLECLLQNLLY